MSEDRNTVIAAIWASGKELLLSKEYLYSILERVTGKDSMRLCSDKELRLVLYELMELKDKQYEMDDRDRATDKQKAFISSLVRELDWQDVRRLNGFIEKMFGVCSVNWITKKQASDLIVGLQGVIEANRKNASKKIYLTK